MKETILEKLCKIRGCQGGTIHQMKRDIELIRIGEMGQVYFSFGKDTFCANVYGVVSKLGEHGVQIITDKRVRDWFLKQLGAKPSEPLGEYKTYVYIQEKI